MKILLVNDDGIHAPSLWAIHEELKKWGDVTVIAPSTEQSGVGHSITFLHPLLAHREHRDGQFVGWKVDGRPADCVKLGIQEFCKERPDVIISGLNAGANVGLNVLYSGTVAAAVEGALYGIPSFALSQWMDGPPDFHTTSKMAVSVCRKLLPRTRPGMLWNINFPHVERGWPRGVRFVGMESRRSDEGLESRVDPRGRTYYWSGLNPLKSHVLDPNTDIQSLLDGYITITPLQFDLTAVEVLRELRRESWEFPLP
ncbi:MAG: 5'/3'-nucleotidase SurE [Planctomycetes bacterium]|nr:5'/3'-nucleotidase SurE [Planctomycetota bacterium]